jgi:multidrug efflux pump subunit AcrB
MLCVLAVFVPSFFMVGVSKSLFVPLSLAVAFAMSASYFLSSSLVPVMSVWMLHEPRHPERDEPSRRLTFTKVRDEFCEFLRKLIPLRWLVVGAYVAIAAAIILFIGPRLGQEIFPRATTGQFQLRFRAPTGTRIEETERLTLRLLDEIQEAAGPGNVAITLGYIGTQPSSYPVDTIYLWTSGPHEAVLQVALRHGSTLHLDAFEEGLRKKLPAEFPGCQFSFEPGDLVSQIMNFGAPTPVEVATSSPDLAADRAYAEKLYDELEKIVALRDLQYEQPLDYPTVDVNVNRERAGQLGVTTEQVGRSLVAATSSSRFVTPNYWADSKSGIAYQVQVEIPQHKMASIQDVSNLPVKPGLAAHPLLGDLAEVTYGNMVGEYDRYNMQRMVTLRANIIGEDLGRVSKQLEAAIKRAGEPPRGTRVNIRGQIDPLQQTWRNLAVGLALAVLVIFLLLSANFQSMRLALVVLSTVPAVICGVIVALLVTGTTLNIQSFMGAIMAIGVAVANAILLVTFAEEYRGKGISSAMAAVQGARTRMRPILMTTMAMVAGMIPMALAWGEGAEQMASLGRAVIGGLLASTLTVLTALPSVFSIVQRRATVASRSLDPNDPTSPYHPRRKTTNSENPDGEAS